MRRIALVLFLLSSIIPSFNSCRLKQDAGMDFGAGKSVFVYISSQGCNKCIPAFFSFLDTLSKQSTYDVKVFSYKLSTMERRNLEDFIKMYYPSMKELHNPQDLKRFKRQCGVDPSRLKNPSVLINTPHGSTFYPQDSVMSGLGVRPSFRERMIKLN